MGMENNGQKMKVLWLTSWYPNRLSPLSGDFLKRHAEAVSLYAEVHVIHVIRDAEGIVTKDVWVEETGNGNLKETIVYYGNRFSKWGVYDKLLSERKYRKLFKQQAVKSIAAKKPALVHVHIGMKAGVIALWLKTKQNIPYIVSEQWTGILKEASDSFDDKPLYWRLTWKKIVQQADGLTAVSAYLAEAIKNRFGVADCRVIPNVVDTSIFYHIPEQKREQQNFIHISTLVDFKNPFLILEAFGLVAKEYPGVKLTVVGPFREDIVRWIRENNCEKNISLISEMPQLQLVEYIRRSAALVLFSKYETFGCVLIEATACGIPVIASDIPVIRETIHEGANGMFAAKDDSAALAETLKKYIAGNIVFDAEQLALETKRKYSYDVIGKQFYDLYQAVLTDTAPPSS